MDNRVERMKVIVQETTARVAALWNLDIDDVNVQVRIHGSQGAYMAALASGFQAHQVGPSTWCSNDTAGSEDIVVFKPKKG